MDFLELSYDRIGFLVSRKQFYSSLYLEDESGSAGYKGEKLFTFNMDSCLSEEFRFPPSEELRLALICEVAGYSDYNKKRLSGIFKDMPDVSTSYIALKIGSRSEINTIPLGEIKLMPGALKGFQKRFGILGIRFKTPDYPQFLIDIESFALNSLFKEKLLE